MYQVEVLDWEWDWDLDEVPNESDLYYDEFPLDDVELLTLEEWLMLDDTVPYEIEELPF